MEFPDLIGIDRDDKPILVVEVNSRHVAHDMAKEILHRMRALIPTIPMGENMRFGMIVDPETISLYDIRDESTPRLGGLNTPEVLDHYSTRFREFMATPFVAHDFLAALVAAWIKDTIFHWRMKEPPGSELFESTGLLEKLEGGWICHYPYPANRLADAVH